MPQLTLRVTTWLTRSPYPFSVAFLFKFFVFFSSLDLLFMHRRLIVLHIAVTMHFYVVFVVGVCFFLILVRIFSQLSFSGLKSCSEALWCLSFVFILYWSVLVFVCMYVCWELFFKRNSSNCQKVFPKTITDINIKKNCFF